MAKLDTGEVAAMGCAGAAFLAVLTAMAAWATHVVVCIKTSSWILLAFGCLVPPVGVVHGVGKWFGVF